mgnify:CR=1 FL=1
MSDGLQAFAAAAGFEASTLGTLLGSILVAIGLIWSARLLLDQYTAWADGRCGSQTLMTMLGRCTLLLMLLALLAI